MKAFQILFILMIAGAIYLSYKALPNQKTTETKVDSIGNSVTVNEPLNNIKTLLQTQNKVLPASASIKDSDYHIFETFNNCGPATLSMMLKYYNINKSQKEIADVLRPYQVPKGDNDDKSVSFDEFIDYISSYGVVGIHNVNGDLSTIKKLINENVPVATRNWLNTKDTIGHFIIIKGYDDNTKLITFDDSYYGPNKTLDYDTFLSLWQPFNYEYFFITKREKKAKAVSLLGDFSNEELYKQSILRADEELSLNENNIYPVFNKATAYYHLGDYRKSIENFEKIESKLPNRMLWYQIEPILSYQKIKNYDKALYLIDKTLKSDNRAFAELYYIRGQIYEDLNKIDEAKIEYKKVVVYNKNFNLPDRVIKLIE